MPALILWLRLPNGPWRTTCLQPSGRRFRLRWVITPAPQTHRVHLMRAYSIRISHSPSHCDWLRDEYVTQSEISLGLLLERPRMETSSRYRFLKKLKCRPEAVGTVLPPWGRSCVEMEPTERPTEKKEREESQHPKLLVGHQQFARGLSSTKNYVTRSSPVSLTNLLDTEQAT